MTELTPHRKASGLLICDFNADNLAAFLNNGAGEPSVAVAVVPFGQVFQTLANGELQCWRNLLDFAVVWTQPENVLEEYRQLLLGSIEVNLSRLETQVDEFTEMIALAKSRTDTIFVTTWAVPRFRLGHGTVDLARGHGISRVLMHANLRLLSNLDRARNIQALNTAKWFEAAGSKSFSPRLWYGAKIPFSNEVFKAAASDIKATLRGIAGHARKLIVLDLDETLWGGIVGDVGWRNLVLGGHDPNGEALVDFQRELKALSNRGVILGIVSKNEESTALEAIEKHPEMVLRLKDIAAWRINWEDKAQNIVDLAGELNLGLSSIVFLDDNPVERDRVKVALPEVLVPDWPVDKRLYVQALLGLDCFVKPFVTLEDRQRAQMYAVERQRIDLKVRAGSVEEWLDSLCVIVTVEILEEVSLSRATQLLNKTNQMNLSTRRMTEAEFLAWARDVNNKVWLFRVADKFGDSGITGIASIACEGNSVRVVDFILSCRVMGRRIEEAMLGMVIDWSRNHAFKKVRAIYEPTAKNKPCRDFLVRSGLQQGNDSIFTWDCREDYPAQAHIRLAL